MELKDYIMIIKKYLVLILVVVTVGTVGALVFRAWQPTQYEASVAITISRVNVQETQDYKFDDFYAIQASELFSRTVVGWLETPADVLAIYEEAGIEPASKELGSLSRVFDTTRLAPQVLEVKFTHGDQEQAEVLANAVVTVVNAEVDRENEATKEDDAFFSIQATEPVVAEQSKNYPLVGVVALLISLFIAYNVALLAHYMSKEKK